LHPRTSSRGGSRVRAKIRTLMIVSSTWLLDDGEVIEFSRPLRDHRMFAVTSRAAAPLTFDGAPKQSLNFLSSAPSIQVSVG
jgi:hypothetical protein